MRYIRIKILIKLILLFAVFNSINQAQDKNDDQPIKVNTVLVNLPVIAIDKDGHYISGLTKKNFSITEDGEKQDIEYFADEEAPMNVAILVDTSFSTEDVLGKIKSAARDFVKIFRPEDKGMVVTFDDQMNTLTEFTSDQKELNKAINKVEIADLPGSDMQDAMYALVTKYFASVKGRKAIIVLTDGKVLGDISNQNLLSTLADSDVIVYPIMFKTKDLFVLNNLPQKRKSPNKEKNNAEELIRKINDQNNELMKVMYSLATVTGGRLYQNEENDFDKMFQAIAGELKHQYLIGFYPQNVDDGKPHQIEIGINPGEIIIRTKSKILLKVSHEK